MKKTTLKLLVVAVATIFVYSSFTTKQKEPQNLAESKSLVGVWHQVEVQNNPAVYENYKFINSDGTFYSIIRCKNGTSSITMYGNYKVISKNTIVEKIKGHLYSSFSNTESKLNYELLDENTLIIKYKNTKINEWVSETWKRVPTTINQK